jgi:hypothetical protein
MHNTYAMYENIVPGVMPFDTAATASSSQFIDLKAAHSCAFLVLFGAMTADSADQTVTITVEAATGAASTSGETIAFNYRQSGAVAANTWGVKTAATSAGLTLAGSDATGTMVWVEVDPAAVAAAKEDARWIKCEVTPTNLTALNVAVCAFVEPRFAQTTMVSTT